MSVLTIVLAKFVIPVIIHVNNAQLLILQIVIKNLYNIKLKIKNLKFKK